MFKGAYKIAIFTSMLIVGGVANDLDLPIDSNGNKILSMEEKIYNGEVIKSIKYMDKDGEVKVKRVDKNGKEIDLSLLISKDKSLFRGKLKQIMKANYSDIDFISDDETLEVIVGLKNENIELNKEPSTIEIHVGANGEEEEIKFNGKSIDKKTFKDKESERVAKLDKARKVREDKMRKRIDTFAKRNKFEKDSAVLEAYENVRSSIELKLKKGELKEFASKNEDLIIGIELTSQPVNGLSSAMKSTKVDPYAINYSGRKGSGIGVYMSEPGCPSETHITNYTHLSGVITEHSENVSAIIRGVSPESYIYCRGAGMLPSSDNLNGTGGHPRVYIESYSFFQHSTSIYYKNSDRNFDNHIYDENIPIFIIAGNITSEYPDGNVSSPGKSVNSITVGNYFDSTKTIATDSRYGNSEIGNEKPEISAPGVLITAGGHTMSGTSQAAPHAAGFAADLISTSAFSSLKLRPYLLKAVMLAGATNVINGGEEKVGVGGIDFLRTYYNSYFKSWANNSFSYFDSTDDIPNNGYIDWKVNLTTGNKTRVTISWLNRGDYVYTNKDLSMDLDLIVLDPNNNYVDGSFSVNNPYEVVNFTPSLTGNYTIRIKEFAKPDANCNLRVGASVNWDF